MLLLLVVFVFVIELLDCSKWFVLEETDDWSREESCEMPLVVVVVDVLMIWSVFNEEIFLTGEILPLSRDSWVNSTGNLTLLMTKIWSLWLLSRYLVVDSGWDGGSGGGEPADSTLVNICLTDFAGLAATLESDFVGLLLRCSGGDKDGSSDNEWLLLEMTFEDNCGCCCDCWICSTCLESLICFLFV